MTSISIDGDTKIAHLRFDGVERELNYAGAQPFLRNFAGDTWPLTLGHVHQLGRINFIIDSNPDGTLSICVWLNDAPN